MRLKLFTAGLLLAVIAAGGWFTFGPGFKHFGESGWKEAREEAASGGYRVISSEEMMTPGPSGVAETPETAEGLPVAGWALVWTLFGVFAGGLPLNLTPCIYPLIPVTISYFGGQGGAKEGKPPGEIVLHSVIYVVGLALMNSFLGMLASLTGGLVGAALQKPVVVAFVACVLVIFALSLFGFWELRLPAPAAAIAGRSYTGYLGTLFMGVTLGLVAAPCIGPFVLGLLTWVAGVGSVWFGFLVFFILSLGMGLPLFFLALASSRIAGLPRSGEWMEWVRKLMGWVLIGMAIYFSRQILPHALQIVVPAAAAFFAGLHLGWGDRSGEGTASFKWVKRVVGILGIALAVATVAESMLAESGVNWKHYSEETVAAAKQLKKPVVLDFYADWCVPCRMMMKTTFQDPAVVSFINQNFVMVKVDLTASGDPVHDQLIRRYGIRGVPTLVFLDTEGKELRDFRIEEYTPPEQFMDRVSDLKRTLATPQNAEKI